MCVCVYWCTCSYIPNGILPACQLGELKFWQHSVKKKTALNGVGLCICHLQLYWSSFYPYFASFISERNRMRVEKQADTRKAGKLLQNLLNFSCCGLTLRANSLLLKWSLSYNHTLSKKAAKKTEIMDHEYSCFYLLLKLLYHIMFLYFNNMHGKLLFIQNYISWCINWWS